MWGNPLKMTSMDELLNMGESTFSSKWKALGTWWDMCLNSKCSAQKTPFSEGFIFTWIKVSLLGGCRPSLFGLMLVACAPCTLYCPIFTSSRHPKCWWICHIWYGWYLVTLSPLGGFWFRHLIRQDIVHQLQLEAQASEYARCFCQTQLAGLLHQLQETLLARGLTLHKCRHQGTCGALLCFSVWDPRSSAGLFCAGWARPRQVPRHRALGCFCESSRTGLGVRLKMGDTPLHFLVVFCLSWISLQWIKMAKII